MTERSVRAVYMRGGAHRGVFFHESDLPRRAEARDRLLLRVMGSPDPYSQHLDGLGGGPHQPGKLVIVSASARPDCDAEFSVGVMASSAAHMDYSENCAHLSAAVGVFALHEGLLSPVDGIMRVRLWQRHTGQRIDALIPVQHGQVLESGQFQQEGVPFGVAEIRMEFHEPEGEDDVSPLLPTGQPCDELKVPGLGKLRVTMIHAACPTVFVRADALDLTGKESPERFNRSHGKLKILEAIRCQAALAMGLADSPGHAAGQKDRPGLCWVARPQAYRSDTGVEIAPEQVDVLARTLSRGKLQGSLDSDMSISVAAAAALPGSVVNELTRNLPGVATRIGQVSGTLTVGAEVLQQEGRWRMDKVVLSASARRIMSGRLYWPDENS